MSEVSELLPPLPKPARFDYDHGADMGTPVYSEAQMRKYALDTIRRAEVRQAPLPAGTVTKGELEAAASVVFDAMRAAALVAPELKAEAPVWVPNGNSDMQEMARRAARLILEAALAARPAAEPVGVRRLEWHLAPVPPSGEWLVSSAVGLYCIPLGGKRFTLRFRDSEQLGDFDTLEAAKAAAQADYEARIRSALVPTPAPGLVEALLPFAKIADDYDDAEDDEFQVWQDFDALGARLPLKHFRAARAALSSITEIGGAK